MTELVTDAIVLGNVSRLENDKLTKLFTRELGLVEAKIGGGLKPTSKLSPHLDPLNLTRVRLVKKNNFVVADALTLLRFKNVKQNSDALKKALDAVFLIKELMPPLVPEQELWHFLYMSLKTGDFDYRIFLKTLGYDPTLARCFQCKRSKCHHFYIPDQLFVCNKCGKGYSETQLVSTDV